MSGVERRERAAAQTVGFRGASGCRGGRRWRAAVAGGVGIADGVPPIGRERVRALWLGGEESVARIASGRLVLRPPGSGRRAQGERRQRSA